MSDGYPSSDRLVADLAPPPAGPAPSQPGILIIPDGIDPASVREALAESGTPLPWVVSAADASAAERLTDAIANLAAAAEQVNAAALNTLGELPWEIAVGMLATIRAIQTQHLGPIDASLVRHLYLTGEHGDTELDGIGVVSIRRSRDRKEWDHWTWQHDVRGAVIEKKVGGQAELFDLDGNAYNLMDLFDAVQSVHGAQAPKVTALRALGLDAKTYCEDRPGKPTVEIR